MILVRTLILSFALLVTGCKVFFSTYSSEESLSRDLRNAERYSREKNYEKAIASYKNHIESRLAESSRPKWENPFFYYLLIGDLYLEQERTDQALSAYEYAELQGVDNGLIADRFRLVANWYAERGDYDTAILLLSKYNDRDPALFDLMRDRVARESVAAEDRGKSPTTALTGSAE